MSNVNAKGTLVRLTNLPSGIFGLQLSSMEAWRPEGTRLALKRQEFHRRRTGSLTLREDRWSVLLETGTGHICVEHRWAYMDPDTERPLNEDCQIYSLEEFAGTEQGQELQSRLRPVLENIH